MFEELRPSISKLKSDVNERIDRLDLSWHSENDIQPDISRLSDIVAGMSRNIVDLTDKLESERKDRRESEAKAATEQDETDRRVNDLSRKVTTLCSFLADGEHPDLCLDFQLEPAD